jgi:hypothetical protein
MTGAQLQEVVDGVLGGVEFVHPVELADVLHVHGLLEARLPGARIEAYHTITCVVFIAVLKGSSYTATLEVAGCPAPTTKGST